MAATRTDLIAQINALLVENGVNAITATLLNALMQAILAETPLWTEYGHTLEQDSFNALDNTQGFQVEGVKVVGARLEGAIPAVTDHTGVEDFGAVRAALNELGKSINAIHEKLEDHGLVSIYVPV